MGDSAQVPLPKWVLKVRPSAVHKVQIPLQDFFMQHKECGAIDVQGCHMRNMPIKAKYMTRCYMRTRREVLGSLMLLLQCQPSR